jgi:hypothetical protein
MEAVAVAVAVGSQRRRFSVVVEAAGWQRNCVRWISCGAGVGSVEMQNGRNMDVG